MTTFTKFTDWIKRIQLIIWLLLGAVSVIVLSYNQLTAQSATEKIAQVALKVLDPKMDIEHYLLNKGVDSVVVAQWMAYPLGKVEMVIMRGFPNGAAFIDRRGLNQLGLLIKKTSDSSYVVLDTLWDFRPKDNDE